MEHPLVVGPETGREFWVWGDRYSFKVTGDESGGSHALMEMTVNPGSGTPPHVHHAEDEMFYVLDGTLSLWHGEQKIEAKPGTFVAIPKGTPHRWINESGQAVKALVFLVPAGFEKFLMRIGTEVTDAYPTAPAVSSESIEAALAVADEYHMAVVA